MEVPKYIQETPQGVTLRIRLQPRASCDQIIPDPTGEQLKVRITAPPVDSAANKALLKYIAKSFCIAQHTVALTRGGKSRNKTLIITGINAKITVGKLLAQK